MKIRYLLALASLLSLTFFFGCSTNPVSSKTSAARIKALKTSYSNLTVSTMKAVADFRGKPFLRPVYTAAYTQAEYAPIAAGLGQSYSPAEEKAYDAILVCEGLLRQNQDFFAGEDSVMATQTAGFYEPGTDSIIVVFDSTASGLTMDDSVTMFHELVHALQDQYYDITTIENNATSSDQDWAARACIEGEADLLDTYYQYKLSFGQYPSTDVYVVNEFNSYALGAELYLDSLHIIGVPMIVEQPFVWLYYSYGPLFIDAIAGTNWSLIDSKIFVSLPYRSFEVMHPSLFGSSNEYDLDMSKVTDSLSSEFLLNNNVGEVDQLGEVDMCVMFREWDFSSYKAISQGLMADEVAVARNPLDNALRMVWYTYWQDSTTASTFLTNYAALVNKKKSITLPAPVSDSGTVIINDTINKVYIEQAGNHVFTFENYAPTSLNSYINELRNVKAYLAGSLAKRSANPKRYQWINKSKLIKHHLKTLREHMARR